MTLKGSFFGGAALALCFLAGIAQSSAEEKDGADPLVLVVMDPLSRELACACVKGYGQRDYRKLAARLKQELKTPVNIEFSDDLAETVQVAGSGSEFLIIGDRSLVQEGVTRAGLNCEPISELTDREGETTLTASFAARSDDPAKELKDIAGRQVLVGLPKTDEKFAASVAALKRAGVELTGEEKHLAYTDAALDLLDSEAKPLPVALLPSYALVMLQGCGSVKPGNLKVIGKSQPVPFITLFASKNIAGERKQKIVTALAGIKDDPQLCTALESRDGFKPISQPAKKDQVGWPDWRGPNRDGRVAWLPARLSSAPKLVWKKGAVNGALAGLTVSEDRVISAERDLTDEHDVYRCLDARDGQLRWRIQFRASGTLDYGQAPRAAPVISGGRVYLLGAFGSLRCVRLADGKLLWERDLIREFGAKLPTWGMCSPPLILGDLLVVNPGGPEASLAALDGASGETRWTSQGSGAAYAAFIRAKFGGREQIVGYDQRSLGGWDAATGKRLWKLVPPVEGDFNVPTPIVFGDSIVVSTENNGTRVYNFDPVGRIVAAPAAKFPALSPDTTTPVITRGRLFGAKQDQLFCLDLSKGLQPVWERTESGMGDHVSLIADDSHVLVVTLGGELILLDAAADHDPVVSRLKLSEEEGEVYAHPALVGTRLFARGSESIVCLNLEVEEL